MVLDVMCSSPTPVSKSLSPPVAASGANLLKFAVGVRVRRGRGRGLAPLQKFFPRSWLARTKGSLTDGRTTHGRQGALLCAAARVA